MINKLSNFDFDGFGRFGLFLTDCIHTDHPLSLFFEAVDKIVKNLVCFHELGFLENFQIHVFGFGLLEQLHELGVSLFGLFLIEFEKGEFLTL
jgi:hypothetical protein